LDDISKGILNQGKISVLDFNQISMMEMAEYCMQDAFITYELTAFNDNLVMNLMVMLQRISKMILEDLSRFGVSRWILALMEWMHRQEYDKR
jgi:DNA polymerase I